MPITSLFFEYVIGEDSSSTDNHRHSEKPTFRNPATNPHTQHYESCTTAPPEYTLSTAQMYISLSEYNKLDMEKLNNRSMKDPGVMKLYEEMMLLIDPVTFSSNVWTTLE